MSSFPQKPTDAKIFSGRVTSVDAARWTCIVRCDQSQREFVTAIVSSAYQSLSGNGVHFMPEIGALCLVAVASDNSGAYLIGGAPIVSQTTADGKPGSYHSNRPFLSPGDIAVTAESRNGLYVTRGGIAELRGSGLSRVVTDAQGDSVSIFAKDLCIETLGALERRVCLESDSEGTFDPMFYTESTFREFIDSPSWSVRTRYGFTDAERVDLEGSIPVPSLAPTSSTIYIEDSVLGLIPETLTLLKPASLDPGACVFLFEINSDESTEESEPSLSLRASRSGEVLVEAEGKIRLAKSVDAGTAQPVLLGTDFLEKLQDSLTEIKSALTSLGILATPATDVLLGDIVTSLTTRSPFLSTVLEAD